MNSLFIKIFLWFWLAMALVWSVSLIPNQLSQNEEMANQFRALTDQRLVLAGWTALRFHNRGGEESLADAVQAVEESAGGPYPFVFNTELHDLAGREAPEGALATARATMDGEEQVRRQFDDGVFAGRLIETRSGNRYAVVQRLPSRLDFPPTSPWPIAIRWFGVLLVSGLVCYGMARYLVAPVGTLSEATRAFATGNLDVRVSESLRHRSDELAGLGHDFDRMAERIGSLLTTQRQLLSDISHELRSPLARQYVALALARRHVPEEGEGAEALGRIEAEAERLNELIGELLSLARLENDPDGVRQGVPLHELLESVVADARFEAQATDKSVQLQAEPAVIEGFEEPLRRAFDNVLRNAVRYTEPASAVDVRLSVEANGLGKEAVVRIRDHGPGVSDDAVGRLFEPFYRTAEARDRESGGAGLGLSISERAVRLHGGHIEARNADGGGLEVEIRLPGVGDNAPSTPAAD